MNCPKCGVKLSGSLDCKQAGDNTGYPYLHHGVLDYRWKDFVPTGGIIFTCEECEAELKLTEDEVRKILGDE